MSGKDAVFETEIKEIRQATDIEIDDDFAKLFGMDELSALRMLSKLKLNKSWAGYKSEAQKRAVGQAGGIGAV